MLNDRLRVGPDHEHRDPAWLQPRIYPLQWDKIVRQIAVAHERDTPEVPGASVCSESATTSSSCTRCAGPTRSETSELRPDDVELTEDEIAEAEHLIERLTRDDLEGDDFSDRCTEAVEQLIDAKRENREPPTATEPDAPGQIVDLMAALQESVAKAKASRGEDATVHEMPKKKAAAAKKTAKKTPAKKAAAKKTTTKKTAKKTPARKRHSA